MARVLLMILIMSIQVSAAYPPVLTEVIPKEPTIVDTCLYAFIARVVDGETVAVQAKGGAVNVRLWGVDVPRNSQWSQKAKQWLAWRVEGKDVALEIVTRAKNGQALVRIYREGSDVGLQMLALGLATAAPGADKVMAETARACKARGIGMWGRK